MGVHAQGPGNWEGDGRLVTAMPTLNSLSVVTLGDGASR